MKKIKYMAFAAAVALMGLSACSQTNEEVGETGGKQPVVLAVSTTTVTRAADGIYTAASGFTGGEQVEVYMDSNSEHATYDIGKPSDGVSNLTIANGETALDYPAGEGDVALYAVYPAASTSSHVVKRDQSSAAGYRKSDLMYAKASVTNRNETQYLTFLHKLVKLKIVITKPEDVGQLGSVTLLGVKRKVTVEPSPTDLTLSDVRFSENGDEDYDADEDVNKSILVAGGEGPDASEKTYTYACVLPENSWAANDKFLRVVLDGQQVTYKVDTDQTFSGGKEYMLTLVVSKNALDGSTASLSAWGSLIEAGVLAPTDANTLTVADIEDQVWTHPDPEGKVTNPTAFVTGVARTPDVTVTMNGSPTLTKGTDYELVHFDNVNVNDKPIAIVMGMGSYAGKAGYKKFNIVKKTGCEIKFLAEQGSTAIYYGDPVINIIHFPDADNLRNTGDSPVEFLSGNSTVATLATNGNVTIKQAGTATITARTKDNKTDPESGNCTYSTKSATFTLKVDKRPVTFTRSVSTVETLDFQTNVKGTDVVSTTTFDCKDYKDTNYKSHIKATSSDENNFTASYDSSTGKITITRKSDAAFTGTVTVTTDLSDVNYAVTPETSYTVNVTADAAEEVPGDGFTVNGSGSKVLFSPGNLQATTSDNGATWTWGFAANQWSYIGSGSKANSTINGNGTVSANGTVDLFGWVGASNTTWTGGAQYGISNSTISADYGTAATDALKSDWGNVPGIGTGWRTLTSDEWNYVFSTRSSGAFVNGTKDARWTHAAINTDGTSRNGIILFPDGCKILESSATTWGKINSNSAWATKCTTAQWQHLESLGCVFLPAAGNRGTTTSGGHYWSSSPKAEASAYYVSFGSGSLKAQDSADRFNGKSVRLVRGVAGTQTTNATQGQYGSKSDQGTW